MDVAAPYIVPLFFWTKHSHFPKTTLVSPFRFPDLSDGINGPFSVWNGKVFVPSQSRLNSVQSLVGLETHPLHRVSHVGPLSFFFGSSGIWNTLLLYLSNFPNLASYSVVQRTDMSRTSLGPILDHWAADGPFSNPLDSKGDVEFHSFQHQFSNSQRILLTLSTTS